MTNPTQMARVSHPQVYQVAPTQGPNDPPKNTQQTTQPNPGNGLQTGDTLNISTVRTNVLQLEAQIAQFKLMEEQQLGNLLNSKLTELENAAASRRQVLNQSLNIVSEQRAQLPMYIENRSVEYSYMRQIEGQENAIMDVQNRLEAYLGQVRGRANTLLAQVNAEVTAGTGDVDNRIAALRKMIGEISASPLTRNLQANQLR